MTTPIVDHIHRLVPGHYKHNYKPIYAPLSSATPTPTIVLKSRRRDLAPSDDATSTDSTATVATSTDTTATDATSTDTTATDATTSTPVEAPQAVTLVVSDDQTFATVTVTQTDGTVQAADLATVSAVQAVSTQVAAVQSSVVDLTNRVATTETNVSDLQDRVTTLETLVDDQNGLLKGHAEAFGEYANQLKNMTARVTKVEAVV